MEVKVSVIDSESGWSNSVTHEILSGLTRVSEVRGALLKKYPGAVFHIQEFKDEEELRDLVESDDDVPELTVFKSLQSEVKSEEKGEDAVRSPAAKISNNSGQVVVFLHKGNKHPTFLRPGDCPLQFPSGFFSFTEAFMLYKKIQEREDGEAVYKGSVYECRKVI